jgi:hypothetical protein
MKITCGEAEELGLTSQKSKEKVRQIAFDRLAEAMEIENPENWDAEVLMLNAAVRIERLSKENKELKSQ